MNTATNNTKNILKEKGIKVTPQRVVIYDSLQGNLDHPTADAVYNIVRNKMSNISFDTVFRTLRLFTESGIIHVASSIAGIKRYDPNIETHHHFECVKCGNIIDIVDSSLNLESLINVVNESHNILDYKLVMTGICAECQ